MRDKPHRIRIVKFKGKELKQTLFLRRTTTPISLCSAADSRTEQVIFYLSFDFHLQFTDKSVGALCVLWSLLKLSKILPHMVLQFIHIMRKVWNFHSWALKYVITNDFFPTELILYVVKKNKQTKYKQTNINNNNNNNKKTWKVNNPYQL